MKKRLSLMIIALIGSMTVLTACGDKAANTEADVDKQIEEAIEELENSDDPDAILEAKFAEIDAAEKAAEEAKESSDVEAVVETTDGFWECTICPGARDKNGKTDEIGRPYAMVYQIEPTDDSIIVYGAFLYEEEKSESYPESATDDTAHKFLVNGATSYDIFDPLKGIMPADKESFIKYFNDHINDTYSMTIRVYNGVVSKMQIN